MEVCLKLTYDSIWPFFVCLAIIMLVACAPLFLDADTPPSNRGNRRGNLDGLRGFLALAVFFQHATLYHGLLTRGVWIDPSRFYLVLGQVAVSLFFMITGYLFWGKLLTEHGRPAWLALYIGRVFRIAPVYLFAVAVMLVLVFARTGATFAVSSGTLLAQIGAWLLIGINGGGPDVNGYKGTSLLLFGVTWTLSSEWKFYASLPLWAFVARYPRAHLPALAFGTLSCVVYSLMQPQANAAAPSIRALLFLAGMICATLERRGLLLKASRTMLSVAASCLLAGLLGLVNTAYSILPVLVLTLIFYGIISGADFFGLLATRPARRLGDVSYSLYLLQGLVTTIVFTIPQVRHFAVLSPVSHWFSMCGCAVLLLLTSTATYRFIERPGIEMGNQSSRACGGRGSALPVPPQLWRPGLTTVFRARRLTKDMG